MQIMLDHAVQATSRSLAQVCAPISGRLPLSQSTAPPAVCHTMGRKHWGLDYTDESGTSSAPRTRTSQSARRVLETHSAPPGFPTSLSPRDVSAFHAALGKPAIAKSGSADEAASMRAAYGSAWKLAFAPARGLLTGGFAVLVSGSSVHLFSIMTAVTVLIMQLQGLMAASGTFANAVAAEPALKGRVIPQFLVHLALCVAGVAGALWQCQRLGFLPTTESDWIGLLPPVDIAAMPKYAGGFQI